MGLFFAGSLNAAYLNRPELVDFNFANAGICEKTPVRIKFDHENFNPGNVFTVEVGLNGNFSGSSLYTMVGSLTQSGNQQNVFLTVTFPANIPAGTNFRLRVRGSSPLTYSSQVNEFPFAVSKLQPSDPGFYPTGYWRGYFYRWTPSTTGVIADATGEDIFNPANYLGYISEDSMSFDYNWGNTTNAPGAFPDTNRVCGSYRDFFSVRMRRRFVFEEGYYLFGGGADDGFRLSLDGGATWLISDWSDHSYRGSMHNNGCGIFLTAGPRDLLVEFYENRTDARFRLIFVKTGDPAVDPVSIASPANGATICSSSPPVPLVGVPPGAWQWSGPGVNNRGWLNPGVGGTGPRTITYQTGFAAFGQNCVKTASITVNVVPGLSASFTGLDSAYCTSVPSVVLNPQNPGGVFSGPGVSGNLFVPASAGPGLHRVRHILSTPGGCTDTVDVFVRVQSPLPPLLWLPDPLCVSSPPVAIGANTPGTFSGPGINGNTFNPAQANPGSNTVLFTSVQGPCTLTASGEILVLFPPDAQVSLPLSAFCLGSAQRVRVEVSPAGGTLSGPGLNADSLFISGLPAGNYTLRYLAGPEGCRDTAYANFSVNPVPDASFSGLPDTVCSVSPNLTLIPNVPGGVFSGQGVLAPDQFSPSILLENNTYRVEYRVGQQGCSNTAERFVFVRPRNKPVVQFPEMKSIFCVGEAAFTPVASPPSRFFLNGQEVTSVNPAQLGTGFHTLRALHFTSQACTDSASAVFRFQVIAAPVPELGPDREVESGEPLRLDPGIAGPVYWSSTDPSFLVEPGIGALQFVPLQDQTVTVRSSDANGICFASDAVQIRVKEKLVFFSFFTPFQGDGKNDSWIIKGGYPGMKVSIFDRWGNKVYTGTTQGQQAWDGSGAGEKGGVYFYLVEHPTDPERRWSGWITVAAK
jgi:gliding motility-associated-like protein